MCAVEGAWWGVPPSVFGPNTQQLVFAEIQCLPWACRATEYAKLQASALHTNTNELPCHAMPYCIVCV